jgi:4-hydroxy-tetrahydrodipicolinate synthase
VKVFLKGSIVALITPFTKNNEVDYQALKRLIYWHLENETDAIVILGTTAEVSTLSGNEKQKIIELTCCTVQKKIPVIVGTGTCATDSSVKNTEIAKKYGVDGCLVIAPYYNMPSQDGVILHYKKIADIGLPTIIYHHPKRTGFTFTFETLCELQKHPNIFAIKDATGDIVWMEKIINETNLKLFSGNDENTFEIMFKKASGSISVIANVIPREWARMHQLIFNNKIIEAKAIYDKYRLLLGALALETNPQCVKYALSLINQYCLSDLRLPLIRAKLATQNEIKIVLNQILSAGNVT